MAGLGAKTFAAGDVLTATDVNGYLMQQAVAVFATTGARTTAIPSPSAGMTSYITGTNSFEVHDGTSWVSISNAGAWTSYTPVITSATGAFTTLTYSTQVGTYRQNGKTVHFKAQLILNTVTVGTASGALRFSLPTTTVTGATQVLTGLYVNNTTNNRYRIVWSAGAGTAYASNPQYTDGTTTGYITVAAPAAIASGDNFIITGTYETA